MPLFLKELSGPDFRRHSLFLPARGLALFVHYLSAQCVQTMAQVIATD